MTRGGSGHPGMTAFEVCLAVALIGAFLGVATSYHRQVLQRGQELGVRADLRMMRAVIASFEARHHRRPGSLEALLEDALGPVRMGGGRRDGGIVSASVEAAVDPFGNRYVYDPATGTVRSQTPGYETW